MKYGSIKGAVTTDGFKDWIELQFVPVGRRVAAHRHRGARLDLARAQRAEPQRGHRHQTAPMSSSPKLFLDAVAGKLDSKVEIKFTTTTKGKVETFLTYETGEHRP